VIGYKYILFKTGKPAGVINGSSTVSAMPANKGL